MASVSACSPALRHTVEPYRSDPIAGDALSARAAAVCEASAHPLATPPERPFATDGCSMFPDTSWNLACCVEHDIAYWCGGSPEARRTADKEFGRCIAEEANGFAGWTMRTGVRIGGHPVFPTSYRWGFGHAYGWGYPDDIAVEGSPPRGSQEVGADSGGS